VAAVGDPFGELLRLLLGEPLRLPFCELGCLRSRPLAWRENSCVRRRFASAVADGGTVVAPAEGRSAVKESRYFVIANGDGLFVCIATGELAAGARPECFGVPPPN
jgi:hypothetical protein